MSGWEDLGWAGAITVVLAAFRITRFFIYDSMVGANIESGSKFSQWLDGWAYTADGERDRTWFRGKVAGLLVCPWCLGFWISLGTVAWWAEWPEARWVLVPWAVSAVVGMMATWERR